MGVCFGAVYKPIPAMFQLVRDLHDRGYSTGLLSNTEIPSVRFFARQTLPPFDATIYSCNVGMRKPESCIYHHALKVLQVLRPEDVVFIDDRQDYLDGAKAVGLHTILFQSPEQVRRELETYLH